MIFKKINKDDILLNDFILECQKRGYYNNSSIEKIKFDYFEYSSFFGGVHEGKLKVFSGVHNFDFDNKRYWRVLFRGVTLYDDAFKPVTSRNLRLASINFGICTTLQMKWIERNFSDPIFVMTSNDKENSIDTAGRSHAVDRLARAGLITGCKPLFKNIEYLYTVQNVWEFNKNVWYDDFDKFYRNRDDITYDNEIDYLIEK